jgi:SAM-dependent methyltransferase
MNSESGFQVPEHAPFHYQAQVERFMAPFVDAMVAATVRRGESVLDVACGTGFAARSAARAVGSSGRVVGSDINAAMVAMARSVPWNEGSAITWKEASALDLPFSDDEFDTVICQQGAQFFPDVAAGLGEMARVTRAGGRLGVTIWTGIEDSPFFTTEFEMLVRFCGTDPDASGTTFVEDGEAQIESWFEAAGLEDVAIDLVEASVLLPPVVDYVPQHLRALPWSGAFFELSDQAQTEALAWMDDRLSDYRTGVGVAIPFRSYLATSAI